MSSLTNSLILLALFNLLTLIAFLPLAVDFSLASPYLAAKKVFLQFMLALVLSLTAFDLIRGREIKIRFNILDVLILSQIFFPICSGLVLRKYVNHQLTNFIFVVVFYLLLLQILQQLLLLKNKFNLLSFFHIVSIVVFAVSFIQASVGLLQFFDKDIFQRTSSFIYESKVIGTMGHANWMGGYLAASWPFAMVLFLNTKKFMYRLIVGIASIIILLALVLTLSRGAWGGLITGTGVFAMPYLTKLWKKSKDLKFFRKTAVFIFVILFGFLLWLCVKINPDSAMGRIFIWKVSWEMVQDSPILGIGYGNYPVEYLNYQAKFFSHKENGGYYDRASNLKDAHSEYLQVLAETGIVGLFLFFLTGTIFCVLAFSVLNFVENKDTKLLVRLCISGVAMVLVHSLVDTPLRQPPIAVLFFFYLSLVSLLSKEYYGERFSIRRLKIQKLTEFRCSLIPSKSLTILSGAFLCIFSMNLIMRALNKFDAYKNWKEGQEYVSMGNYEAAIRAYEKALKVTPNEGELRFHLGGAYVYSDRYSEAISELEKATLNFNDKNIYYCLGYAYQQLGNYHHAEMNFRKVQAMFPSHLLPHLFLAKLYHKYDRIEDAITELKIVQNTKTNINTEETMRVREEANKLLIKELQQ